MMITTAFTEYQQIIVKFKSFSSRTQVYRARKCKAKISVRLDLTEQPLDLRNSAYEKVREHPKTNFVWKDCCFSICLFLFKKTKNTYVSTKF